MIPTAEKFWLDNYFSDLISDKDKKLWLECNNQAQITVSIMIEFAKLHVEAALKEASKKAKISTTNNRGLLLNSSKPVFFEPDYFIKIEKNSILNAYPESNIN